MLRREFLTGLAMATLRDKRLDQAAHLIDTHVKDKKLRAATLLVRRGQDRYEAAFGEARSLDAVFLIASITKPMAAAGVMKLVERGRISLSDPVTKYIPEFREEDRAKITIKHLLTHTSGLPDQLPDTNALRQRHAPLSEFVARTLKTPLLFHPGTKVSYQSMGILLASEIAQRVADMPFPLLLERELFSPLGMRSTALGLGRFTISQTMTSQVEFADPYSGNPENVSWNWNSPYWRGLGAPWGGAHSTARDISRMLDYFLHPDGRVLRKETVADMITNQNVGLNRPWGIGWGIGGGKSSSPRTFGHSGATGTKCWADPDKDLTFVLLTTLPSRASDKPLIQPVSDLVSSL